MEKIGRTFDKLSRLKPGNLHFVATPELFELFDTPRTYRLISPGSYAIVASPEHRTFSRFQLRNNTGDGINPALPII